MDIYKHAGILISNENEFNDFLLFLIMTNEFQNEWIFKQLAMIYTCL